MARVDAVESIEEESGLLLNEPLAQVIVSAVGESADEVRDVVVLDCFGHLSLRHLGPPFSVVIIEPFDVDALLLRVVVDLLGHHLMRAFLVGIVHELDLLEHLQPGNGDALELKDANGLRGRFVVEADLALRGVLLPHVLLICRISDRAVLAVLEFAIVYDHRQFIT